eukprot:UN03709
MITCKSAQISTNMKSSWNQWNLHVKRTEKSDFIL